MSRSDLRDAMTGRSAASLTPQMGTRLAPMLTRLAGGPPRRRIAGYAAAILGTVALTAVLLPIRETITPLSKGFGFLIVVVVAAALGGLGPGVAASLVGFLTFNFFFLPPYGTFIIRSGEDVVVLFVFLGLSILISALLARATERAEAAEARQEELGALQSLGAQLVTLVPGPDSYGAVMSPLLELFGYAAGSLWVQDPDTRDLRERVTVGGPPGSLVPHWDPAVPGRPPERLPLSVGGRNLGLVVLQGDRPPLTPPESRVLRAFCDQFALVLERDRLLRTATEAEVFRQTDRVRRSLLAAVSHDLRSPLAAIKASVTDLLDQDTRHEAEQMREALESINQESDRLASLIANLLDMTRIEGGMLKARIQSVDLAEVIAACVDRIRAAWPRLSADVRIGDGASVLRADPLFLDRVLTNLLDNAAKASAAAGTPIRVVGERVGSTVVMRVIDQGPGLPESVREQLFYPFYQMTDRHPRLGTGLGLAICKGFLARMGGEVWIEDTPGGGATFAFSLPASVEEAVGAP